MIFRGRVVRMDGTNRIPIVGARVAHACDGTCNGGGPNFQTTNDRGRYQIVIDWDMENRHQIAATANGYTAVGVFHQPVESDRVNPVELPDIVLLPYEEEAGENAGENGIALGTGAGSHLCGADCSTKDTPCARHVIEGDYCYQHRGAA